ncbi:MAG: beta-ketoacyl synthase N-terminal-like domain-containing protein, partial [Myxococcota bacterium]
MQTNQKRRIVISGMSINTRLGDNLETFYENLMAGRSGLTNWRFIDTNGIYSKVGGDLSAYDTKAKLATLKEQLPAEMHKRMRKIVRKAPFSTTLSMLCATEAWLDAGLDQTGLDPTRLSVIVSGHNLNKFYQYENDMQFFEEPDYMDNMAAVLSLDTDHAGSVAEVLGAQGSIYTMGGACASANVALRNAVDEVRYHEHDVAMVVGAALEFSPMSLHAMALLGAISFQKFNDQPDQASRPYDLAREGFIPSHGTA